MTVEEIIKSTLNKYSYFASDECIREMVAQIEELHAEDVELAWQYRELDK